MLKVINVITDTNIGGAGKCVLTYLDNYDKNIIDLEVFIPPNSLLKDEIEKRNVKYTEVIGLEDTSLNFSSIGTLKKLINEKKPDIIHTHAAMSARIAAKFSGNCKIVHTRHSVFDQPEKYKKFPLKQIRGGINNYFSDEIIAVSPAAMENLTDTGTSSSIITIVFNGTDKTKILSAEEKKKIRERYSLTEKDFVVSIIARLEEVKGHDYVLDSAKILLEKDKNIKILIAGTGNLESHLKERVKKENINNVIFTGFLKAIYEIENIMDLQINASYGTEATSLSLLEGMSLGKPAVVSDFGGNPYVIKENINGIVVPKKNSKILAETILKLKEDSNLYELLSENSIKEFENKYTSKKMVESITDVYIKLCERRS